LRLAADTNTTVSSGRRDGGLKRRSGSWRRGPSLRSVRRPESSGRFITEGFDKVGRPQRSCSLSGGPLCWFFETLKSGCAFGIRLGGMAKGHERKVVSGRGRGQGLSGPCSTAGAVRCPAAFRPSSVFGDFRVFGDGAWSFGAFRRFGVAGVDDRLRSKGRSCGRVALSYLRLAGLSFRGDEGHRRRG